MIISRTPFRISFAGGGSDMTSFYKKEAGVVLSTSIDKYMYITIHECFDPSTMLIKYSKTELVHSVAEIQHPLIKQVFYDYNVKGVDLNSIADIPAGTGLGSSSSFTVGLINAVRAFYGKATSGEKLARLACEVEIEKVGSPIGKQDQYAAACGGLNYITFYGDESVNVEKIIMDPAKKRELQDNLLMIYIGGKHSANDILKSQQKALNDHEKFAVQKGMVELAGDLRRSLEKNQIDDFGKILHEGWLMKKSLTAGISTSVIDDVYNRGLKAGAVGGKLLGAGGAGFILFYVPKEKQDSFRRDMCDLRELHFNFDDFGSKIIYVGEKFNV